MEKVGCWEKNFLVGNNFFNEKGIVYSEFLDDKEKWYFMAESCMSIKLVLSAVRESERKDRVTIWLPAYFCSQTYYSFKEDWVDSIFYPVNEQLEPDWNWIKEKQKKKCRLSVVCPLFW